MTWWLELLPLALLGAVLGLDVVSFPQAMFSRPIMAATLTGALIGRPVQGLIVGAVLELFALETLPVGASRYPEWASASVIGAALFASEDGGQGGSLAIATLAALITAMIGSYSMILVRRLNASRARARLTDLENGSEAAVKSLQLGGLTADLARGFLLTGSLLALFRIVSAYALPLWSTPAAVEHVVVTALAAMVGGSALWNLHHSQPGARWLFAGGLAAGCLALVMV